MSLAAIALLGTSILPAMAGEGCCGGKKEKAQGADCCKDKAKADSKGDAKSDQKASADASTTADASKGEADKTAK